MQHVTYGSTATFNVTTEDKRINNNANANKTRFLCKFTNDLSGTVKYAYGQSQTIRERYTDFTLTHNTTENVFTGAINFKPYGFWKYEIYEVTWQSASVVLSEATAPDTETEVITPADNHIGVVQGLVEQGKLLVSETVGSEQVKYTQYTETTSTNYIYTN
jgi:hypothetical protein